MNDSEIDRAARATDAPAPKRDDRARAARARRRPVATRDGRALRLRQPRGYLLFGRPVALVWLVLAVPCVVLANAAGWWILFVGLPPFAIAWSHDAWRSSATLRVTEQGNVGIAKRWGTASAPASAVRIELAERSELGWVGECVISSKGAAFARVRGLSEIDMDVVTAFGVEHGVEVMRVPRNFYSSRG